MNKIFFSKVLNEDWWTVKMSLIKNKASFPFFYKAIGRTTLPSNQAF